MKCLAIERWLTNLFYRYAKIVSRWPAAFCICPTLVAVGLGLGCLFQFRVLEDEISLYTPSNGEAVKSRSVLDQLFPINDTDSYYVERRYKYDRSGFLILSVPYAMSNILDPEILAEASQLWHRVKTLHLWSEESWINYDLICIKTTYTNSCVENPILTIFDMSPAILSYLKYPYDVETGIYTGNLLGGVTVDPVNGSIVAAEALILPYQLRHGEPILDQIAENWEKRLGRYLEGFKPMLFEVNWWTSETLGVEADKDTKTLIKLLGPLFVLVTLFTVLCCLVNDSVRSKPLLGLGGVVSACGAIISAMGLMAYFGQSFTTVTYFMPFIIFSIGVDNVFILFSSWHKTSTYLPVSERMALVFQDVGVSITVTSLTDGLSFAVGCLTAFPSVQNFCSYAAVAVCFVYVYQLTFFASLMVLAGNREAQGRHCITCMAVTKAQQPQDPWITEMATVPPPDINSGIKDHVVSRFFRTTYTEFITHPVVQGSVMVLFLAYLGIGIWGCTQVRIGLEPSDLLPKYSRARDTLRLRDEYFSLYGGYLNVIFTNLSRDLNYDAPYWLKLSAALDSFENTDFTGYSDSWLRLFLAYAKTSGLRLTPENFVPLLQKLFLQRSSYEKYQHDIVFNEVGTRILATRFPVRLKNMGFNNHSGAMTKLRKIAKNSPLNTTVFADFFNFADQYDSILPTTLVNVGIATVAVVVVSLILIPKPLCSVWVSLSIVSINVGIFGYMTFWGVKLDFVSMVTIIMSIGFCVDFSAHIAYHFGKGDHETAVDRIRSALHSVGLPIVQSALSTILGISLLVAVDNYIYRSFVKTVSLVTILGAFHGLMVLPVLLTLFYCRSSTRAKNTVPTVRRSPNGDIVCDPGAAMETRPNGASMTYPYRVHPTPPLVPLSSYWKQGAVSQVHLPAALQGPLGTAPYPVSGGLLLRSHPLDANRLIYEGGHVYAVPNETPLHADNLLRVSANRNTADYPTNTTDQGVRELETNGLKLL